MRKFYERSHPLNDHKKIFQNICEQYESEWKQGSLFGWESILKEIRNPEVALEENNKYFCVPCNKRLQNEECFETHVKGKKHIKMVNRVADKINETTSFNVLILLS